MAGYQTNVDIGNRALQHVGQTRMGTDGFAEDSKAANEVAFCYDKVRRAELERNCWTFATKVVALRAIGPTTMMLVPAAWNAAKTYEVGSIVSYQGVLYCAAATIPLATEPDINSPLWDYYVGPMTVSPYDASGVADNVTSYYAGELVYVQTGNSVVVYLALTQGSADVPGTIDAWDATIAYNLGDTAVSASLTYQSAMDLNLNNTPVAPWLVGTTYAMSAKVLATDGNLYTSVAGANTGQNPVGDAGVHWTLVGAAPWITVPAAQATVMSGQNWLQLDATVKSFKIVYPVGAGPQSQSTTRNAFWLPNGFLKLAPQDPRAGSTSFLGAPSGLSYTDWVIQDKFLTSRDQIVILLRFVGDFVDVNRMHTMFCEGLACRIAVEICEPLTQSDAKINIISGIYKGFMGEARLANAIENGTDEPPVDDYIACRV